MNSPAFVVFDDGTDINLAEVTKYFRKDRESEGVVWLRGGERHILTPAQADLYEKAREAYVVFPFAQTHADEARALSLGIGA